MSLDKGLGDDFGDLLGCDVGNCHRWLRRRSFDDFFDLGICKSLCKGNRHGDWCLANGDGLVGNFSHVSPKQSQFIGGNEPVGLTVVTVTMSVRVTGTLVSKVTGGGGGSVLIIFSVIVLGTTTVIGGGGGCVLTITSVLV